jgi:NACHT domain
LHHRARELYESGTGEWALRSPDWTNWTAGTTRCLWIRGIPGAGKTVLASHLIESIKAYCLKSNSLRVTYAYYYCYHGHHQDEVVPFLRWIIARLCRQSECVPVEVYKLYKQGGQPSIEELLDALESIATHFGTVYLVVDALDESNPRCNLLRVLDDFVKHPRFEMIQLLATSREYVDIDNTMNNISSSILMSNPLVEGDIRLQVRSSLRTHPKFRHWPDDLLAEVEDAVSTGANGMYVISAETISLHTLLTL